MRKRSTVSAFIILLLAVISCGSKVGAVGKIDEKTEDIRYQNIDQYLQKEVAEAHIPGMSVILVDKDEVLFSKTYGNCDSIDDPFIIGSNSKSFTAVAIMQLVEQNKVHLDEPISTYLPDANEGNRITVRQLLNHTSGISTYDTPEDYKISSKQGAYEYANANYALLGQIIEQVTGVSYCDYIQTTIFDPLQMKHSYTSLEEAKKNHLIDGYRNYFGIAIAQELPYPDESSKSWITIPAGYLISSASDMGNYLQSYLNGGAGVLKPESIQKMFYENVKVSDERSYGFGWGIMNNYPEPVISHGGLVENYITHMFILPESEIAGVIFINENDYLVTNEMTGTILYGVLAMLFNEEPTYIGESTYVVKHLLFDALYLLVLFFCIAPLVLFRKWKKQLDHGRKVKKMVAFLFLHIVIPTGLLCVPAILETPASVFKSFVPDLYIVLVGGAVIAYVTGILKLITVCVFFSKEQTEADVTQIGS